MDIQSESTGQCLLSQVYVTPNYLGGNLWLIGSKRTSELDCTNECLYQKVAAPQPIRLLRWWIFTLARVALEKSLIVGPASPCKWEWPAAWRTPNGEFQWFSRYGVYALWDRALYL